MRGGVSKPSYLVTWTAPTLPRFDKVSSTSVADASKGRSPVTYPSSSNANDPPSSLPLTAYKKRHVMKSGQKNTKCTRVQCATVNRLARPTLQSVQAQQHRLLACKGCNYFAAKGSTRLLMEETKGSSFVVLSPVFTLVFGCTCT